MNVFSTIRAHTLGVGRGGREGGGGREREGGREGECVSEGERQGGREGGEENIYIQRGTLGYQLSTEEPKNSLSVVYWRT